MDGRIGTTIDGRFRLERLLGAGGMGKVYAATQLSVGHTVAVKVLRSDISELHTTTQRFFREAQVMAALRHPNIVGLIDYGQDEDSGAIFIVMEFVDGRSLTDVLRRGRIPLGLALLICRQICSGLAQAHSAGIVHRDLKPDNVMLELTAEGRICAKLLDFGIALPQGPDETRFTATGGTLGTPRYMSPEQAKDGAIQNTSDFYALGVILYEMIAGEPPFQADTPMAVLFKTVHERHTPITDVLKGFDLPPGPVSSLIDELLAKDPEQRPQSAAMLGRRFDQLIADLPAPPPVLDSLDALDRMTQPAIPVPVGGLDTPQSTAQDGDLNPPVKAKSRSLAPLLALGVFLFAAVVVVAAAAGAIIWASYATTPTPPDVTTPRPSITATPVTPVQVQPPPSIEPEPKPEPVEAPVAQPSAPPQPPKQPGKSKKDRPKKPKKPKRKKPPKARSTEEEYVVCQRRTCNVELESKGATIVCQGDATCYAECSKGGCQQRCMGGTCEFDCKGGGCTQACFPNSTCTFSCKGDRCQRPSLGGDFDEVD